MTRTALKGGDPAAPSGTATLLRLRPSRQSRLRQRLLLPVRPPASGVTDSHDVTGGVYKPRERIHRTIADARLLATPASSRRVAACYPNYDRLCWDSLHLAASLPVVPAIVACV
jgi:hypothetical protein